MSASLRRTPLFDAHVAAGGKMVPFAGWEMPVQYGGLRQEHKTVRSAAGMFDVSHMGEIETSGPEALHFLQRILSNDVSKIAIGGAQYSCLCRDDGGVLDDLFTYRLADDRFLTVTNASNHETDFEWFASHAGEFDIAVKDVAADYAMLAVQGPTARAAVAGLAEGELPARFRTTELEVAGAPALVCGTGYTGEDGVEVLVGPDHAIPLWDALLGAGVAPAGLGARDTLRLEVGYCLYGNELTPERTPIEAGIGWCCKEHTGFIGSDIVARRRSEGPGEELVAFALTEKGVPRRGNRLLADESAVGEVTSGTFSPSLENGVGLAYVEAQHSDAGTGLEVDIRGKLRPAQIETSPLFKGGSA